MTNAEIKELLSRYENLISSHWMLMESELPEEWIDWDAYEAEQEYIEECKEKLRKEETADEA